MKLKDNWIARNLLLAAAFIIVLIISASILLRVVTKHGKTVTAPDFTNLTVAEAQELAHSSHVSVKVVDSVFVRRLSGGVVYRQLPKAGSKVKVRLFRHRSPQRAPEPGPKHGLP